MFLILIPFRPPWSPDETNQELPTVLYSFLTFKIKMSNLTRMVVHEKTLKPRKISNFYKSKFNY